MTGQGSHTHEGQGGVTITLASIYDTQQEMLVTLAEIKGSLALQAQQDRNDKAIIVDHETRIRKLEMKVYAVPGAMTLLTAGALAWSIFGK